AWQRKHGCSVKCVMVKAQAWTQTCCTDGYEFDAERQACRDIDECAILPDACKGGMRCTNHFGGYLCLPPNAQIFVTNGEELPPQRPETQPSHRVVQPNAGSSGGGGGGVAGLAGACHVVGLGLKLRFQLHISRNGTGYFHTSSIVFLLLHKVIYKGVLFRAHSLSQSSCLISLPFTTSFVVDVNECEVGNPCQHQCYNIIGSFLCQCDQGYELAPDSISCQDVDECSFSSYMCQYQCVNQPGGYVCTCPEGYQLQGTRMCQDINECETGHNCQDHEMCWNYHGGFRCYPRNPCHEPYVRTGDNRCSCQSTAVCHGLPPSIVYKYMNILSGRSVPADIFQIQATNVYANSVNTFRIKSGNEGREFYLRRSSNVSAMLVMTKPLTGPREYVVDLEMVSHNVMNYRSSSLLRLTIIVGPYSF
uniref:EGF containing fibulin extracellular matrix protein 1 n=1 Tax=Scleropages formosus TaxID=113540 RepID=A0A8C9S975_SCLFO